eukprot:6206561-Pleurochrysis_carterae.AAC.2
MASADRLQLLQRDLRPLMLRRTKETVDEDNQPIVALPPRTCSVMLVDLTPAEADFYRALHSRSKTQFETYVAEGKALSNYASVLELLLRLRQACDHPYLAQSRSDTATSKTAIERHLRAGGANTSHSNKVLQRMLAKRIDAHRAGKGSAGEGAGADGVEIDAGDGDGEPVEEQDGGDGSKFDEDSREECPVCLEPPEDAVVTSCGHTFCRECALALLAHARLAPCP